MKCVVNWISLRIHVRSRNTKPHLKVGLVFSISCLQNGFRKDPQVEPKFCRSLLTTKFVDVAPVSVVINM